MSITWTNEQRKLSDLQPWERNPRRIQADEAERLVDSFDTFGQVQPIAISPDGDIYDGHQRRSVLAAVEQYGPDYTVDVRVSDRPLTEKEREQLTVYLHRGATGTWDFGQLVNGFDIDELQEWGFSPLELGLDAEIDPVAEWRGMPEFVQEDKLHRTIHVHFKSQADVDAFAELVGQTITEKTRYLWYPAEQDVPLKQFRIVDES